MFLHRSIFVMFAVILSTAVSTEQALSDELSDVRPLYHTHCAECHEASGRGDDFRDSGTPIPDFTSEAWFRTKSRAEIRLSILQGKGDNMPPFEDVLSKSDAERLASFIGSFAAVDEDTFQVSYTSTLARERQQFEQQWASLRQKWQSLFWNLETRSLNSRDVIGR